MKFTLQRSIIDTKLSLFISAELKRRGIVIPRATNKNLEEMAVVFAEIQQYTLPRHLLRKKLPGALGYGIFLHPEAEPILRGTVISPYAGKVFIKPQSVIDESDYAFAPVADIRLSKKDHELFDTHRRWHPKRLYEVVIDADQVGNFTRFINHSEKPNVAAEELAVPKNAYGLEPVPIEIVYIAKKKIQPGEQLLVSYEGEANSYWAVLGVKPLPITPRTFRIDKSLKLYQDSCGGSQK